MNSFVKRLGLLLIVLMIGLPISSASADWRWAPPNYKVKKVKPVCPSFKCKKLARNQTKTNHQARVDYYHSQKLKEWKRWTRLYIPRCTWYGESGTGPEYARYRYITYNSEGSGARGKFQFMPRTYYSVARYKDWSPLDQEIAARREYWRHGIYPWANCTG